MILCIKLKYPFTNLEKPEKKKTDKTPPQIPTKHKTKKSIQIKRCGYIQAILGKKLHNFQS